VGRPAAGELVHLHRASQQVAIDFDQGIAVIRAGAAPGNARDDDVQGAPVFEPQRPARPGRPPGDDDRFATDGIGAVGSCP
jgi:hypothetical protein